jgi:hypothetical protein
MVVRVMGLIRTYVAIGHRQGTAALLVHADFSMMAAVETTMIRTQVAQTATAITVAQTIVLTAALTGAVR